MTFFRIHIIAKLHVVVRYIPTDHFLSSSQKQRTGLKNWCNSFLRAVSCNCAALMRALFED